MSNTTGTTVQIVDTSVNSLKTQLISNLISQNQINIKDIIKNYFYISCVENIFKLIPEYANLLFLLIKKYLERKPLSKKIYSYSANNGKSNEIQALFEYIRNLGDISFLDNGSGYSYFNTDEFYLDNKKKIKCRLRYSYIRDK